jgi:hypothetical protein
MTLTAQEMRFWVDRTYGSRDGLVHETHEPETHGSTFAKPHIMLKHWLQMYLKSHECAWSEHSTSVKSHYFEGHEHALKLQFQLDLPKQHLDTHQTRGCAQKVLNAGLKIMTQLGMRACLHSDPVALQKNQHVYSAPCLWWLDPGIELAACACMLPLFQWRPGTCYSPTSDCINKAHMHVGRDIQIHAIVSASILKGSRRVFVMQIHAQLSICEEISWRMQMHSQTLIWLIRADMLNMMH